MRKLNLKNKILLFIFVTIILLIIISMAYAMIKTGGNAKEVYSVNSNDVFYDENYQLLDTSLGGTIRKNWNGNFTFVNGNNESYSIGEDFVIYNKLNNKLFIFGNNYQVFSTLDVTENKSNFIENTLNSPAFFKLSDRKYLIIANEISSSDKTIIAKNYLEVDIDTNGNASLLNDSIILKTINPMVLTFANYSFDVAKEILTTPDNEVDLKTIGGSTNKYIERLIPEPKKVLDDEKLSESYNALVNDFSHYATNNVIEVGKISSNTSVVTTPSNNGKSADNKTPLTKRVSLRGSISYSTYIDISYYVIDPENKYQAVYLLVTGEIDGTNQTKKYLLDKYQTTYRISGLSPKSEYSIVLGYIEVVTDSDDNKKLYDNIEDSIISRTTKESLELTIDKIGVGGYVYFTFKMHEGYYLSKGFIAISSNNVYYDQVEINIDSAKTENGFKGKIKMPLSQNYKLYLKDAKYNDRDVSIDLYQKFSV